jgi:hypothetical protein
MRQYSGKESVMIKNIYALYIPTKKRFLEGEKLDIS